MQPPVPTSAPTSSAQEFLPVGQWDSVIDSLHGVIFHGVERIKSAQALAALGCSANKEQEGKRIKSAMRRHGWLGPKVMRFADGSCGSGYWRPLQAVPRVGANSEAALAQPLALTQPLGPGSEASLPEELQDGCRLGIRWARGVLRKPVDPDNGNLLRAQGTAAALMVGSQLRADEARLRRQQSGDVLDRLEKLLRETEAKIPLEATALPPMKRPRKERGKLAAPQDDVAPASRSPER